MGKGSGIAWTDHTFNPWWGCVEVSPACDNCYARTFAHRLGAEIWGQHAQRRFFGDKHWNEPRRWNERAAKRGAKEFVFCASMADVFESHATVDLQAQRDRLWSLIAETPSLIWLLLTKRPGGILRMTNAKFRSVENVWIGVTVESPDYLWRIDSLVENCNDEAWDLPPKLFVSMEPLVAHTTLAAGVHPPIAQLDWVITGCESGAGARNTPLDWYRTLRDECATYDVPFFLKQADAKFAAHEARMAGTEPLITIGEGSWTKAGGIVEQPYLDGVQHIARPAP